MDDLFLLDKMFAIVEEILYAKFKHTLNQNT